jgi:hypothetical protein
MRFAPAFCILLSSALLAACESAYTTPGGPANLQALGLTPEAKAALTDISVQKHLDKKPLVTFPATIAVARVQAGDYTSYSYSRYGTMASTRGAYSVITIRDIEKDDDFTALSKLPEVAGVASLKRILLDNTLNSDLELRTAAAKLHCNLLLYYTFDTAFQTDTHVAPLGLVTLGMFPNKDARVTCTASAVLMDVNNGYVYSVAEATAQDNQLANAWTSAEAVDQVRRRTERKAFEELLASFKSEWPTVLATYNRPAGGTAYNSR